MRLVGGDSSYVKALVGASSKEEAPSRSLLWALGNFAILNVIMFLKNVHLKI